MGLSVVALRTTFGRLGRVERWRAGLPRLPGLPGPIAVLRVTAADLPVSLVALAPLLLGPAASWASLRDLLLGLMVLILVERATPRLAASLPSLAPAADRLLAGCVVLGLAAASFLRPGLAVLALLAAACDLARSRYRRLPVAAACLALAAAIRVDAGALLLDAARGILLPLAVAAVVLLVVLVGTGPLADARRSVGPTRESTGVPFDLARLAAFALALGLGLAVATDAGALAAAPSAWAVLGALPLAGGLLALLASAGPGDGRVAATSVGRLGVAAVLGWALMLAVATRIAAAG